MARCFQPHLQHLAYYSLFFTIFQFLLSCSFTVPLSLPQLLQFLNTQSSKSLGEGLIPCLPKQPVIESATLTAPVLSREKSQRSLRWIWAGSWFMELSSADLGMQIPVLPSTCTQQRQPPNCCAHPRAPPLHKKTTEFIPIQPLQSRSTSGPFPSPTSRVSPAEEPNSALKPTKTPESQLPLHPPRDRGA